MKGILVGAVGFAVAVLAGTATVLHFGWLDVAADAPHGEALGTVIEFARERSIERRIRGIVPPADLDSPERVRRGAGNYEAMCAGCHLAPGTDDSELRRGLYPRPPKLTEAPVGMTPERLAARRFWVIKHGIMASGMPAWSKGGMDDADIWNLTAFVGVLPTLTPRQYRQQVAASGGHMHGGHPQEETPKAPATGRAHDHGSHAH